MAQERFWNWKDDDLTARLNSWYLGIHESGLYRGFDFSEAIGNVIRLDHVNTGYLKTESSNNQNLVGIFITKQGTVITQDDTIELIIPPNTFDVFKKYLIVADHSYVQIEEGVECVYSVLEGGIDGLEPALLNPTTDTVLGVFIMPPQTSNTANGTYIRSETPDLAGVSDRYIKKYSPIAGANFDLGNFRLMNVLYPVNITDGTNVQYVQDYVTANATPDATTTVKGKVELATQAEANSNTENKAITAQTLDGRKASKTLYGLMRLATNSEAVLGVSEVLGITPSTLIHYLTTGDFVQDSNYTHTDNNLTDELVELINTDVFADELSYANGVLSLKANDNTLMATEFLPILKEVKSTVLPANGRQYLTFKDNNATLIDEVAIVNDSEIIFQCVIQDSVFNSTDNIGASISEGFGIDPYGETSKGLDISSVYNVSSALLIRGSATRTLIQVNINTDYVHPMYEVSIVPMYWNASTTELPPDDLAEIGNRITKVNFAVIKITESLVMFSIGENSTEDQAVSFLVTGRRLKTNAL